MSDKDTQDFNGLEIPDEELDAEEQVEEEVDDEEDNESPDGDSTVDDDDEEEDGQDQEESEFWEDEKEYLKSKGIEDAESLDDVLERYSKERNTYQTKTQQLDQLDAMLKSKGFVNGINDLLTGSVFQQTQVPKQPEQSDSYFNRSPFSEAFKEYEANLTDENTKKFYGQFNKFADKAISPLFAKVEEMYTPVIQNIIELQKTVNDMRWATLDVPGKDLVTKEQFQQAMESYGLSDPEKVMNLLAINNPKLLEQIQQRGVEKGKKKFKKFKKRGMNRGKQTQRDNSWKKYFSEDYNSVNREMLEKLDEDTQLKYLELAEKHRKK